MPPHLHLIDLFSLVFQVFHAIPEMTAPNGQPVNATFGIMRDLLMLLRDKQPTHLVVAGEGEGPGERSTWYPEYKANRSETPAELISQIPMILETIEAFGVPLVSCAGWEADDVIATLATRAAREGFEVTIVTSDKDARQLLGPNVRMYNVRKNVFFGPEELLADWGVTPDKVVEFQALVGDSVDNVPGVPLVGPKKASALLAKFGDLEGVLAHADEAPGAKLQQNLKEFADLARLSKRLVTLNCDLPIELDWSRARVGQQRPKRLAELCHQYGFRRMISDLKSLPVTEATVIEAAEQVTLTEPAATRAAPKARQGNLFGDDEPAAPVELPATAPVDDSVAPWEAAPAPATASNRRTIPFHIVDTSEKFEAFLDKLRQQPRFCLDLETTSVDAVRADIVGWAFAWSADEGYYLPIRCPAGEPHLDEKTVVEALRPILQSPDVTLDNQNIKYDLIVLERAGIRVERIGFDPMIGSYLLEAGARSHNLEELARRRLGRETIPISDLIGKGKDQKSMADIEVRRIAEYAVEDACLAWELSRQIEEELRTAGLTELYETLERPLVRLLADLQTRGIHVDPEALRTQSGEAAKRLDEIQGEIHTLAGRPFNIDSPLQLRDILFNELGLPVKRKTKTGASTDQDVLEELAALHPLPAKILEHRALTKLRNTYLDALPAIINPATQRIHTSFNQVVASTGRLSSSEPNLQNIPIRTDLGRRVRRAFQAGQADWSLVSADYSQVELRMLAHFCGDPALVRAFAEGADIHAAVAAEVFGVPQADVTSEQRRIAKAVNFGVVYGQSPFGLAATLGIPRSEAAAFIDGYFTKYAGIDAYLTSILKECVKTGFARTILGRRRAIEGIVNTTGRQRNLPERTAINTVIQGSAADLIKRAMLHVEARLLREQHPGRMLLQIHDELVFETPTAEVASLARIVREEMEQAMELRVPLRVDVEAGPNWLDTEKV
jgi:DNA polymerase I